MSWLASGERVLVTGHRGMVGSAVCRRLAREACELVTAGRETVDLRRQSDVEAFLGDARPSAVVIAAATVGGIESCVVECDENQGQCSDNRGNNWPLGPAFGLPFGSGFSFR